MDSVGIAHFLLYLYRFQSCPQWGLFYLSLGVISVSIVSIHALREGRRWCAVQVAGVGERVNAVFLDDLAVDSGVDVPTDGADIVKAKIPPDGSGRQIRTHMLYLQVAIFIRPARHPQSLRYSHPGHGRWTGFDGIVWPTLCV